MADFEMSSPDFDAGTSATPRRVALLLSLSIGLLYALPTSLEFAAMRSLSPWMATVFPGDAVGCAFLMLGFRKVRLGLVLYLLLTSLEGCLYLFRVATPETIPWLTNLVPTLFVGGLVLRSPDRSERHWSFS